LQPSGFGSRTYAKKPILSREGANVELVKEGVGLAKTEGKYSTEACVYQELFAIPDFGGGRYPVIGSWTVGGEACGMGIREDGLITGNTARFIPHIIEG
jgi:glutathionylspermidine synthase